MAILNKAFQTLANILPYLFLAMVLASCSSDDDAEKNKYDHPHPKTIDMKKHLFEHEFSQQCIANETTSIVNKGANQKEYEERCMCIAIYLFKDLTAKDSYTLLNDKKHAQLLRNKYEDAADHCV